MTKKEEKIKKIIAMYAEKKEAKEIAMEVGYSNPRSLSRFMTKMNYRWDAHLHNYIPDHPPSLKTEQAMDTSGPEAFNPLDLLENAEVIRLLQQSNKLLDFIENQEPFPRPNTQPSYNLWQKAQEFAYTKKASYTTSVRLPIELYEKLQTFREQTNLTQTQVMCLALDYFISQFHTNV
ncbi:hypothetical protein [Anoxybacteroides rupiense]|uniref:hypothetical protein n=1 Tax=Anoxybacteroides rupiense TaxID=311460 RepID=UPI001F093775|nr:hypothetical protein [Anoxybacillus rupiensis]